MDDRTYKLSCIGRIAGADWEPRSQDVSMDQAAEVIDAIKLNTMDWQRALQRLCHKVWPDLVRIKYGLVGFRLNGATLTELPSVITHHGSSWKRI